LYETSHAGNMIRSTKCHIPNGMLFARIPHRAEKRGREATGAFD